MQFFVISTQRWLVIVILQTQEGEKSEQGMAKSTGQSVLFVNEKGEFHVQ